MARDITRTGRLMLFTPEEITRMEGLNKLWADIRFLNTALRIPELQDFISSEDRIICDLAQGLGSNLKDYPELYQKFYCSFHFLYYISIRENFIYSHKLFFGGYF